MEGFSSLKSFPLVLQMLGYSFLKWAAAGGMVWLSLWMYGEVISFGISMVIIALSALAVTLPSAPGYVGTVQAVFVFGLTPFGISQEIALAASVSYLLGQWIPVTLVGALFLVISRLSLRGLEAEGTQVRPAGEDAAKGS